MVDGKLGCETLVRLDALGTNYGGFGQGLHGIVNDQCKIGWYRRRKLTGH